MPMAATPSAERIPGGNSWAWIFPARLESSEGACRFAQALLGRAKVDKPLELRVGSKRGPDLTEHVQGCLLVPHLEVRRGKPNA